MKKYKQVAKLKKCKLIPYLKDTSSTRKRDISKKLKVERYKWVDVYKHYDGYNWLYLGNKKIQLDVWNSHFIIKTVEILPWYKKIIWYLTSKLTHKVDRNQTQN